MAWLCVQDPPKSRPQNSRVFSTDQIYLWSPPNPVTKFYYRCERTFQLDTLIKLYETPDQYAIVLISGKRCDFYLWSMNSMKQVTSIEESLPNQHTTGGQSALRFERNRDEKIGWYVKKIVEIMIQIYVRDGLFKSKGLIIAGPSQMKDLVMTNDLFVQYFKKKLLKVLTIAEISDNSIHKVIAMSTDVLSDEAEELMAVERFEQMLNDSSKIDLIVFGSKQVEDLFDSGHLQEIWIGSSDPKVRNRFLESEQKTKVIIIQMKDFGRKYGDLVGIRYYAQSDIDILTDNTNDVIEV